MTDLDVRLEMNRGAVEELIRAAERSAPVWMTGRSPGKWTPSQVVEHVALSLEEGANVFAGRSSKLPTVPSFLRPIARTLLFNRVLKRGRFPKAKTNKEMDPGVGPLTPDDARQRLRTACDVFERECRACADRGDDVETPFFGTIPVLDFVRFAELHTRHHTFQMPSA